MILCLCLSVYLIWGAEIFSVTSVLWWIKELIFSLNKLIFSWIFFLLVRKVRCQIGNQKSMIFFKRNFPIFAGECVYRGSHTVMLEVVIPLHFALLPSLMFYCIYILHFINAFTSWLTVGLFPLFGYCK